MKPELIKKIVQQATARGAALRFVLTNGKSVTVAGEEFLWITEDMLGLAHSANPQSGPPRNPTFLDPKEVAEVESLSGWVART